jgi:hypothetical protein
MKPGWNSFSSLAIGAVAFTILGVGAAGAPPIAGFHLVSIEDCGNPLQEAHLVVEGKGGQYAASLFPDATLQERTYSDGNLVIYKYPGLPSTARYKVRAVYLSDTANRRVKVLAGGMPVDGPFAEPQGKVGVREFEIPAAAIHNGELELRFEYAGNTASDEGSIRVSSIELWSTSEQIAGNLVLSAAGNNRGEILGRLTNWLYEGVSGAPIRIQSGPGSLSTTSHKDGNFSVGAPPTWRTPEPGIVTVRASHRSFSASTEINSYEIYAPDIRLTPRPMKAEGLDGPLQLDLGGTWNFTALPPNEFWKPGAVAANQSHPIQVPGEWSMQGFSIPLNGTAGYWRTFEVPAAWTGKRVKLKCDAAFSLAEVWVNGHWIGKYEGGFSPFEFDITDNLEPGKSAVIALRITQDTVAAKLSAMTNYAQHELGGITRKIYLFAVPEVNISKFHVETRFDRQYRHSVLRINLGLANQEWKTLRQAKVRFRLVDPDGKEVSLTPSEITVPGLPAGADNAQSIDIPVPGPQHWENEHPRLYTLSADLIVDGQVSETVERRIGFREIEIRGNQLLLNGHAIRLHGVERHETNPLLGRSLTPEIWEKEVRLLHEANMNYVFTSHYPVPEEFLDLCDQAGILVTEEMPLVWVSLPSMNEIADGNQNPTYYSTMATVAATVIEKDRDHPSIIFWQSCDECNWGRNAAGLLGLFNARDPSRPVNFAWEANTSKFFSDHYPSLEEARAVPAGLAKGFIYDQYAHINNYNRREVLTDPGLRDYYGHAISPMWEVMYANPGIIGGAIWEWSDDIFLVPPRGFDHDRFHGDFDSKIGRWRTGYGPWGIVDSWLRKKPEFWNVKKTYSPIRIQEDLPLPTPIDGRLEIPIENRYDFTNLNELRVEASADGQTATAVANVLPRSKGVIVISLAKETATPKSLLLKFFNHDELVDVYRFVPSATSTEPETKADPGATLQLEQTGKSILVRGKNFYWEVDRSTGLITAGQPGASAAILDGPSLAVTRSEMASFSQLDGPTEPLQPAQMPWKTEAITAREDGDAVLIEIAGSYPEYKGKFQIRIDARGHATVGYQFEYSGADLDVREIGLLFGVPVCQDTIRWNRKGLWSWYPSGHIGRLEGSALAFRPDGTGPRNLTAKEPKWPWEEDSTVAGTNDFRATKYNIFQASLVDLNGYGMEVVKSGGRQSVRTWLDRDTIRLLVTDFSNGGSEGFLRNTHYATERRVLRKGVVLSGSVTLALIDGSK